MLASTMNSMVLIVSLFDQPDGNYHRIINCCNLTFIAFLTCYINYIRELFLCSFRIFLKKGKKL